MKPELDFRSPTWRAIEGHATERLAALRLSNDRTAPIEATENTRGQIKAWKELLALPEKVNPAQPAGDQH